jgi:hypothetical protein
VSYQFDQGFRPRHAIAEGWTATFPENVFEIIDKRTDKTWPSTFFCTKNNGERSFYGCLFRDELLGSQSRSYQLRTHRCRFDYVSLRIAYTGMHA